MIVIQKNILLKDNDRHRIATGVKKFHDAGYYGERVKAATGEYWGLEYYNPDGLVHDPLNIDSNSGTETHDVMTAATFFQVAPKAQLYMLYSVEGNYNGDGTYTNKFLQYCTDIVRKEHITNMFISNTQQRHEQYFKDMKAFYQSVPDFKAFWCAGNKDEDDYNKILELDETIGVGAYVLFVDGTMNPAMYSSESKYVDFCAPTMIYIKPNAKDENESGVAHSGTSFSTPWLCGMACLVDDFFIDKTGRPLSREAMYQFFKDHCVDIGKEGFDVACGWGAVVLPDPKDIDIWKYQTKEEENMQYKDDNKISDWAKEDVYYCTELRLFEGDEQGNFNPQSPISREEMACVIARLHKQFKK